LRGCLVEKRKIFLVLFGAVEESAMLFDDWIICLECFIMNRLAEQKSKWDKSL
jgi:hypothetical protein